MQSVPGQTIPTIFAKSSESSDLGSYIEKDEHGCGSPCQPWWLYLDRRPCSLAIRAVLIGASPRWLIEARQRAAWPLYEGRPSR